MMTLIDQFKNITTFALDVDGVMTNGSLYVFDDGQQVRGMSTRDGYALQLAVKKGYRVIVISGGAANGVTKRLNKLGITEVHMDVHDKKTLLLGYMQDNNVERDKLLYMGDDIPDYMAMLEAGLPCAPADAAPEIKKIAHYISSLDGGNGCVREVVEKVLKLNGHWELSTDITSR